MHFKSKTMHEQTTMHLKSKTMHEQTTMHLKSKTMQNVADLIISAPGSIVVAEHLHTCYLKTNGKDIGENGKWE